METEQNTQTESQPTRSERIASRIMRILAITGLIALLALVSWGIVQGVKLLPNANENMGNTVTAMKSIFKSAPLESLHFDLQNRTVTVGESFLIEWVYSGETAPNSYKFSYACDSGVSLSTQKSGNWADIDCDQPIELYATSLAVMPRYEMSRFANLELTIQASDELSDKTTVTVVNSDLYSTQATSTSDNVPTDTTITTPEEPKEQTPAPVDPKQTPVVKPTPTTTYTAPSTPTPAPVTVRTVRPMYNGPADLVLNIEETGLILKVAKEDTFFPVSPIPSDKVAGVKFTVTNKGGELSESWKFTAKLPVEGDDEYEYTSPKQLPLASGMQMEFMLGFDEILEENSGVIKITLLPSDKDDKESNNIDSTVINIDIKD
jgi:hypothetical protein